jgi:hypothetical protein
MRESARRRRWCEHSLVHACAQRTCGSRPTFALSGGLQLVRPASVEGVRSAPHAHVLRARLQVGKHTKKIAAAVWNKDNVLAMAAQDRSVTLSDGVTGDTLKTFHLKVGTQGSSKRYVNKQGTREGICCCASERDRHDGQVCKGPAGWSGQASSGRCCESEARLAGALSAARGSSSAVLLGVAGLARGPVRVGQA